MIVAVELYPDKTLEKLIQNMTEQLPVEVLGRKWRLHLTLGKFNQIDEAKAEEKLTRLVRRHKRIPARFPSVGVVPPGTICLCPVLNELLYSFHLELHETFHFAQDDIDQYAFGNWQPHLTLARYSDGEQLLEAFRRILSEFEPLAGEFDRVALVELEPTWQELCSFKLRP